MSRTKMRTQLENSTEFEITLTPTVGKLTGRKWMFGMFKCMFSISGNLHATNRIVNDNK